MNDTQTIQPNIPRLLDLARWLTKEERARRLGEPSHWDQGVWVQTDTDDINELPIDVVGKPGGEQPVIVRWSCGTAACAAGHISLEDGGAPAFIYNGETFPVPPLDAVEVDDPWGLLDFLSASQMYFGDRLESIEEHAQRALGLTTYQAGLLFHGDNAWITMIYHISQFTGIPEGRLLTLVLGGEAMPDDPDGGVDDYDPCAAGTCDCGDY